MLRVRLIEVPRELFEANDITLLVNTVCFLVLNLQAVVCQMRELKTARRIRLILLEVLFLVR